MRPPENFDEFSDEEPLTPEEIASGIVDIEEECKDEKQLRTDAFNAFMKLTERDLISDEPLFREMTRYYSMYFKGGMGAETCSLPSTSPPRPRSSRPSSPTRIPRSRSARRPSSALRSLTPS